MHTHDSREGDYTYFLHAGCTENVTVCTTIALPTCSWTSIVKTQFGYAQAPTFQRANYSFTIPNVIPTSAREVLIYATVISGLVHTDSGPADVIFSTRKGGNRYEKYLRLHAYHQDAINTNSDNMWFPMPPDRTLFVYLPASFDGKVYVDVSAIGYR